MAMHQVFDIAATAPSDDPPTKAGKSVKLARNNSDNSCFNLHSEDSSDEEKETRVPRVDVDLEALFEFDTETLVKLASTACGKQPQPLWDSSRVPEESRKQPVTDGEMQKLLEQKDKQIEVLKKTVCDLLVWKAKFAHTQLQPEHMQAQQLRPKRGSKESLTAPGPEENQFSDVMLPVKRTPMRADAPEFVSLGIPLLIGSPKSTSDIAKSEPAPKPVNEKPVQREWRNWRAGRSPPRSVWKSRDPRDWRFDKQPDASTQKKQKSGS
jgi:hypothetical protein